MEVKRLSSEPVDITRRAGARPAQIVGHPAGQAAAEDGVFLSGPLPVNHMGTCGQWTPAVDPRGTCRRDGSLRVSRVQDAAPSTENRAISAEEAALLAMIDEATKQGTAVVSVVGPSGIQRDIRIHGSSPEDFGQLQSALVALREHDPHDILLRDLKDIYVADHIEGASGLAWRRGPEDTPVFLSRENCRHLADPDKPFLHVLYHEIAHVIDNAHEVSKPSPVQFGRGSDPDDYISRYAYDTNDCREDFAESFAAFWRYRTDPRFDGQDDANVVGTIMNVDRRKSFRVWNKLEAVPGATEPGLAPRLGTVDENL